LATAWPGGSLSSVPIRRCDFSSVAQDHEFDYPPPSRARLGLRLFFNGRIPAEKRPESIDRFATTILLPAPSWPRNAAAWAWNLPFFFRLCRGPIVPIPAVNPFLLWKQRIGRVPPPGSERPPLQVFNFVFAGLDRKRRMLSVSSSRNRLFSGRCWTAAKRKSFPIGGSRLTRFMGKKPSREDDTSIPEPSAQESEETRPAPRPNCDGSSRRSEGSPTRAGRPMPWSGLVTNCRSPYLQTTQRPPRNPEHVPRPAPNVPVFRDARTRKPVRLIFYFPMPEAGKCWNRSVKLWRVVWRVFRK